MAIEISRDMLEVYVGQVVNRHIANHDIEPETVEGYAPEVGDMVRQMRSRGDEGALKLGIEYLLGHPEIDTVRLTRSHYPFDEADMRAILRYIHKRAWPGQPIPATPPDVRLVQQPVMEWWARKDRPKA
jgi:hypothetical protein